jgi:hypothetical protein
VEKEDADMNSSSEKVSWLDQWWPLLLILFGLAFVWMLVGFSPTN